MTYNAYPACLKIQGHGTKIKSQYQQSGDASSAVVRDRDLLQFLGAVCEVHAGQYAFIQYKEPDLRAGSIEKPCWEETIFYPVILFENQRGV